MKIKRNPSSQKKAKQTKTVVRLPHGRGRSGVVRRVMLTDAEKACILWCAICNYYPGTQSTLSEIINAVDKKLLPLWINNCPPFVAVLIENRLKGQSKEGTNG
jgi:hypothetical protein